MNECEPLVVFTPSGKRGRFTRGTPVLQAARTLGVDLDSVCGGRGICSRCQVEPSFGSFPKHGITSGEDSLSAWNHVEERYDRVRGLKSGRRLGCQARIMGDNVIDVPLESQVHKQVIRKSADERPVAMDPATRLRYITVEEPDMHHPSGDFERVQSALAAQWDIHSVEIDISVLQRLQPILRRGEWKATAALHRGSNGRTKLTGLWPGFFDDELYGLAIDLGSTTIAAHLCSLSDGKVIGSASKMNPQIRFGEDLMSRVSYAMLNPGGSAEMTRAVRETLNELIRFLAEDVERDIEQILETVIVCNPVMHHLILGIDPVELGQAPFALATANAFSTDARSLQLDSLPEAAQIYFLPCIAGHVGADCAAVVLAEQPHNSSERVLAVDVGTNAEIVFGDKSRVLACSSPTGPAFEGAQISSGQRATIGAIERVRIDPDSKEPRFKVIGCDLWSNQAGFAEQTAATGVSGICGSGIIEAIAEMRICGIVDASGLIGSPTQANTARMVSEGRTFSFLLYDGSIDGGPVICITQSDVRAVQLAKSALYAGARLLMDEFGNDKVDRVVLAGAFGSHISAYHAMVLGLIPDCALEQVVSAGNAAGTGARMALCSVSARQDIERIVGRIEKIETAVEPRFQEHFVNANALPHSTDPFPELAKVVTLDARSFNRSGEANGTSGTRRRRRR